MATIAVEVDDAHAKALGRVERLRIAGFVLVDLLSDQLDDVGDRIREISEGPHDNLPKHTGELRQLVGQVLELAEAIEAVS